MNIFELLHGVQDARARLAEVGVSLDQLLWVSFAASLVATFALREILGWYLKINQVRRDLGEIKALLTKLQAPAPPAGSKPAVPLNLHGPERF